MIASNLGFPRIGRARELKTALEQYWAGQIPEAALREVGRGIRRESWSLQVELGIEHVPSNDFSLYDHVLDMATVVGAVPSRFAPGPGVAPDLAVYFAMARGASSGPGEERPGPAPLRMTKWFDTNYHFLVPELEPDTAFGLASTKPIDEFLEARALGIHTRPVLLGPVTFALLSRIVLSIEGARSGMAILGALRRCAYPNDVGPGVYDVHSAHVPGPGEVEARLQAALAVLPIERLWVNPDCGLKTRRWNEVRPALTAMVAAARRLRAAYVPAAPS